MEKVTLTAILILAVVQGLTEFLPISSSAHLVFAQSLMKIHGNVLALDVILHVGTLAAVVVVFRQDLARMVQGVFDLRSWRKGANVLQENVGLRMIFLIVVASIPTGVIGILFHDQFEAYFGKPEWAGIHLVITGIFLWLSGIKRNSPNFDIPETKVWMALVVGFVQGLSILPGISRSGSTIIACLFLGLHPAWSARFSFLLGIPAILGAALLEVRKIDPSQFHLTHTALGFCAAMAAGILSLHWVVSTLKRGTFRQFSYYAIPVGMIAAFYFHFRP